MSANKKVFWKNQTFPSLSWRVKPVIAIKTVMAIMTVLAIKTDKAIVRLLRPLQSTHNQKDPSNFRSKKMGAPAGDLDSLINPLALTNLIE